MPLKSRLTSLVSHWCLVTFIVACLCSVGIAQAPSGTQPSTQNKDQLFEQTVAPFLNNHCVRCHRADEMTSGVRVDHIVANAPDSQLSLLKGIAHQLSESKMPPEDEPQPSAEERTQVITWIERTLIAAMSRETDRHGIIRRLTVAQYRNTLRELLGLEDDLTASLPPDGISKDGFVNHAQTLLLSPLQVEAYFDIAQRALDKCLVNEDTPPAIQNFRMDIGKGINTTPCPDKLTIGFQNLLLDSADFVVNELAPNKTFAYQPRPMQTKFDFIEGYIGNDTIREWRKFDSIYHAVFACLRGTPGYPKGDASEVVSEGLLLRPAVPSSEIFGEASTYGPMANFKVVLRELPESGNFRITIKAARYDDALLLEPGTISSGDDEIVATIENPAGESKITITQSGIYLVNVAQVPGQQPSHLSLKLDDRLFSGMLSGGDKAQADAAATQRTDGFIAVRLEAGDHLVNTQGDGNAQLRRIELARLEDQHELSKKFEAFEKRVPQLGVHLGLRRDCGSTLNPVGQPQAVRDSQLHEYVFTGAISNFPSPDVEPGNVNYLAGLREIAVRNEYTDGRDAPRLLVHSVEFEGPYFDEWPPKSHQAIFTSSESNDDPKRYAKQILKSFATRAFRRPVSDDELAAIWNVWHQSFERTNDFRSSIKDALVVVLTAPQFLFLIEESAGLQPEDLSDDELASKLSYFLWNGPPDERLLQIANERQLHQQLDAQIDRMIGDPKFEQAMQEFVSQWLTLDKFDVVSVDAKRFPNLTRLARQKLRQEPIQLLQYLIRNNLDLRNLIHSDFLVANEITANYYGLADRVESGFEFVPVKIDDRQLGGVLCQAAVLSGLSDGREGNPVKRGAWFARKILADPPPDPPPNVPQLPKDDASGLTLRQKIEQHRSQAGCTNCHTKIDPWGLPFEQYDAAGLFKRGASVDAATLLPDGAKVSGLQQLKSHLIEDRVDQVAFSFVKHLACYATGRTLTYNELEFLKKHCKDQRDRGYPMKDLVKFVIASDIFLKK